MESSNQTKSQEVFGNTSEGIIKKTLERVTKDFPKEEIYRLYHEGRAGDTEKAQQARDMFGKALGKFVGEIDYLIGIVNRSDYIEVFLKEYEIENLLNAKKVLDFLWSGDRNYEDPQIIGDFRFLIYKERCPFPKHTIARLIQSFDPDFMIPQMSLPSGYQVRNESQQIPAISNEVEIKDEAIKDLEAKGEENTEKQEDETSDIKESLKTKDNSKAVSSKFKSFFQNKKNTKALACISAVIGICAICGGVIYALNSEDKNKKAVGISLAAFGAFFSSIGSFSFYKSGSLKPRPPRIWYIGRKFDLDNNFLALSIEPIDNGRVGMDRGDYYHDIYDIFHNRLKPILDGTHPRFTVKFSKEEDRDLYIEVAKSYVRTWYNMIEEFPDVMESFMEQKKKRDERSYFVGRIIPEKPPGAGDDWGKVFLDTNPQPWGPGVKPENWREGDGIVKEEEIPLSSLDLSSFPVCECSEPKKAV